MKTDRLTNQDRFRDYASRSVPRYTSYPTANHFHDFTGAEKAALLKQLPIEKPVSVYLHIPFCDRLCWFCGCHTKQSNRYAPVKAYIETLVKEIELTSALLPARLQIAHLHLGGGSPSLLKVDEMARLREALERCFEFLPATEVSVELDPKHACETALGALKAIGITRGSLGVQDFSPEVQQAINRPQSVEDTAKMRDIALEAGARAVNLDVLYGLPRQTLTRASRTFLRVAELNPDRIALFGYAHVPWMKKHQNLIKEAHLPDTETRLQQMVLGEAVFETAGYRKIGIDHFAKPGDTLSMAERNGCLHRNFQGYTTDHCENMIGFGASAISFLKDGYVQNTVPTNRYTADIEEGKLSASKGLLLCEDDHVRRHIIERLMCDFEVDFEKVQKRFGCSISDYQRAVEAIPSELSSMNGHKLKIHPEAQNLARIVASYFDTYLTPQLNKHSLAV